MKRSHLDLIVAVTAADVGQPISTAYTQRFPVLQLAHLEFFLNAAQLVVEEDVLHVDLCQQGLSPWPICGKALGGLVDLFKPLAISPEGGLAAVLGNAGTALVPVLLAADALSITKEGRQALDPWARDHLSRHTAIMMVQSDDEWLQLDVACCWKHRVLEVAGGTAGWDTSKTPLRADIILHVVRWAALEMYSLLDQMQLNAAREFLAQQIVGPGRQLLYGEATWKQQLKQLLTSGRLSKEGQHALFAAALEAKPEYVLPSHSKPTLSLSLKDAFALKHNRNGTAVFYFDTDACECWMPLTICVESSDQQAAAQ